MITAGIHRLSLLFWILPLSLSSQQPEHREIELEDNPGKLKAFVFAPPAEVETPAKRPLVVALHGCSQNHKHLAEATDWDRLATENDFVMLYPQQRRRNNPSNCFNWFKTKDISRNSGEVQSIVHMIDQTVASHNIDTSRIYVYGVSAGAAMGVCLMALYPSYFDSGAILAGAPYGIAHNSLQATSAMLFAVDKSPEEWARLVPQDSVRRPYPQLLIVHGILDRVVSIHNSYELIEQWTSLHEIDTVPDNTTPIADNVDRITFEDSSGTEDIVFYKVSDIGHAIPVDPGTGESQGGKTGAFARDVDFFSTYEGGKGIWPLGGP